MLLIENTCLIAYLIIGDDFVQVETEPFNGLMVSRSLQWVDRA